MSERPCRRFLAPVLLIALGSVPGRATGQIAPDYEVVDISFEGNEAFSDKSLHGAILTDQTHCRTFLFKFPFPFCPLTNWGFAHVREYLEESELPLDLLRLRLYYRQRGFRHALVDTAVQRGDGRATVGFLIEENEPTRIISLSFVAPGDVLDTARVRRAMPVQEGDPLDLLALGEGERQVTDGLRREGYINATVLREYFIPRDSREASVTLRVEPGPRVRIGAVIIEGSGAVGDEVVRELLRFHSGDWFREERILESQRRLYDLEALRWANIAAERRSDTDTLIDVRVQVVPAPPRSVRTGFGLETDECAKVQAQLSHRNFLGKARVLRATWRLSNLFADRLAHQFPCNGVSENKVYQKLNYLVELGFTQPVFSAGRNTLRMSIFTERETVPDLYVRTGTGGEIALTRRLDPRMLLTLAYRPQLTSFAEESADIYFCVNFGVCSPEDIAELSENKALSPVSLLWSWDRTDNPFSASRGFYLATELERASQLTLSAYRYFRATMDAAVFRKLGEDGVLGAHLRIGGLVPTAATVFATEEPTDEIVHPAKRFFAGGPQSVRGYGLNLLGPTVLVLDAKRYCEGQPDLEACAAGLRQGDFDERPVGGNVVLEGSVEARYPLSRIFTVAGFVDFGQVWQDFGERTNIVFTPGAGLRVRTPVGPFRLDIGYNAAGPTPKQVVAVKEDDSIEELTTEVLFDPPQFRIQLSIGEAF